MSRRIVVRTVHLPVTLALILAMAPGSSVAAEPRVPAALTRGPWSIAVAAPAPLAVEPGFAISRGDGNDVRGDLDLRSMRISRGRARDTISFSTYGRVSNRAIDPPNGNFAVLIDTNDDRDFDLGQYVFFTAGRLRGVLVNLRTDRVIDRTAPVSRTGSRGFRTAIQRGRIDSPGTYRFAVFSHNESRPCSRRNACTDAIPNRYPLIPLDHTAPTVDVGDIPAYASDEQANGTLPVGLSVQDDPDGTGIQRWVVERKAVGAGTGWTRVDSGRNATPTVVMTGTEGSTYDVRVTVTDRQKNRRTSRSQRTSFPFDDRNVEIVYAGSTTQGAPAGAFLDTVTSLDAGATATLAFTGAGSVCVVLGPVGAGSTATADLTIDAADQGTLTENDSTQPRGLSNCFDVAGGSHSVTITGETATAFVLDGIYVAR